jgi:predicted small lipoprotein YifL
MHYYLPTFGQCLMTPKFKRIAFLAVLLISGCGQTGPLFIPEPPPPNPNELDDKEVAKSDEETAKKDG